MSGEEGDSERTLPLMMMMIVDWGQLVQMRNEYVWVFEKGRGRDGWTVGVDCVVGGGVAWRVVCLGGKEWVR